MIKIPIDIIEKIRIQAIAEIPNEACGYLAGKGEEVSKIYEMTNADKSPEHFSLNPEEQFEIIRECRKEGLSVLAVYHSHPSTPARMSEEDIRLAYDPNIIYLIFSILLDEVKAFKVVDGTITEIKIEVVL